jgi:competence protein ComEA
MEWLKSQLVAALSGDQKVSRQLLIALAGLVCVVCLVLVATNKPKEPPGEFEISEETQIEEQSQLSLFVHVVGEVENPGMYQLSLGARLVDAVFAAGGLTKKADHSSVNLAREISDGEQIFVMAEGEQAASFSSGQPGLVSLNRSMEAELETLPGIGPALAARIIAWREANGGFKKVEDLQKVSGIGEKLLAGLKEQVTL